MKGVYTMKKIISLLLVAVLMMGLSITALAADEDKYEHSFKADAAFDKCEASNDLPAGEKWFGTKYGFVQLKDDGTFLYKANTDCEELQKILDGGYAAVDSLIVTYFCDGIWTGRRICITIQPEGVKGLGYTAEFTLTDLNETIECTALTGNQTTDRTALRVGHGRIELTDTGYVYTHYPWLDVSKNLAKDMVNTEIIPILCGDAITEVTVRTIGVKPVVPPAPVIPEPLPE